MPATLAESSRDVLGPRVKIGRLMRRRRTGANSVRPRWRAGGGGPSLLPARNAPTAAGASNPVSRRRVS